METAAAPTQAAPVATEAAPDFSKMSGAQASAYLAAQKAKEAEAKGQPKGTVATQAAPATNSADMVKEAAAEAKRKLKIDDQEIDEDEVIKTFKERKGHQQAANKILQEGKLARKQAEEVISMLKDPQKFWEIAKKLGHDPRTLSEKQLVSVIEEEMLDPREKELRDAKHKLKEFEDLDKKQKEAVEENRRNVLKDKFAKDYTEQFTKALSETQIPATKGTVAEMAKYIARSAAIGFKMTALEAAQLVREDMLSAQKRLIGDTDGETLIKLLGEDVANKIRKWDTSRLKNPQAPRVAAQDQPETRERRVPHKRMTSSEWRKFNRS